MFGLEESIAAGTTSFINEFSGSRDRSPSSVRILRNIIITINHIAVLWSSHSISRLSRSSLPKLFLGIARGCSKAERESVHYEINDPRSRLTFTVLVPHINRITEHWCTGCYYSECNDAPRRLVFMGVNSQNYNSSEFLWRFWVKTCAEVESHWLLDLVESITREIRHG